MSDDMFELEEAMGMHATERYVTAYVMPEHEAAMIERAAEFAYAVMPWQAEQARKAAGYAGLDHDYGGATKYDFDRVQKELSGDL